MPAKPPSFETGEAFEKKGDLARAAEAYEKSAAESADERTLLHLAAVRERLGQAAAAANAYRRLAELHERAGFMAKSTSALRQALRLAPDNAALAQAMAERLEADGKLSDAAQVLEAAGRAAAQRGDHATRLQMLEKLATLDGGVPLALALADALAQVGRRDEALQRLQAVARRLGEEQSHADQLAVLERVLVLTPDDRETALRAGKIALLIREPRRGLAAVRVALDHFEDAELVSSAARALDAMGEKIRGTLLHREAGRRFERAGERASAWDEWRTVLAFDPADTESLARMRGLSGQGEPAPEPPPPPPAPPPASKTPTLEINLEDLAIPASIVVDIPIEPLRSPTPAPIQPEPMFALSEESSEAVTSPGMAIPAHEPRKALVVGDGAEAAWIERALGDLDVAAERVEAGAALERAEQSRPDLVFAPPTLAQAWRDAGSWLVAGPVAQPRGAARPRLSAAGVPCLPLFEVKGAADLKRALESWGAPVEIVGNFGEPIAVPSAAAAAFQLTVAREKLGAELLVQPGPQGRVEVLVACDGRAAVALADWESASVEGLGALESPASGDEQPRRALAERIATTLKLCGTSVVVLGRAGAGFAFDAFRLGWGPGGLAAEARTGLSLVELAMRLARGGALPGPIERRGVALAARVSGTLGSVANLRVEPSPDGAESFVCAHASDRTQAARRLVRALKPGKPEASS